MDQNLLIAFALIAILILALVMWLALRRRQTDHLRDRFGAEYDHAIETAGDRAKAEAALAAREKRVATLDIRPMTVAERHSFTNEWHEVKAIFVDSPTEAVLHADRMLASMMKTVGYPMADFNQRYEDLTVNYADVAMHYREGRAIVERHGSGPASTEDMRQAMKHYEAVFDCLVADANGDEADLANGHLASDDTISVDHSELRDEPGHRVTRT